MKTLIIGGVAGGATAAARLRRLDEKAEIVIIEKGEYVSFANCGLPYYIGGVIKEKRLLTLQTPESFRSRFNVEVRTLNEALYIDAEKKTVSIKDRNTDKIYKESYDKLLISTGAKPVKLPIRGIEGDNVFTLRNVADTFMIKQFAEESNARTALIIGGGFIGIEMAENLKNIGIDVYLAELSDHVIASLDVDMASEVHRYIKSKGIKLLLNNGIKAIEGKEVTLNIGKLHADIIISAAGVRPDTEIAIKSGIAADEKGRILTDPYMKTNLKDIYAVGDAVSVKNFISGEYDHIPLAGPANKQGRIAADNIAGYSSEYKGAQGSSILKIFDMSIASTGLSEAKAASAGIDYDKTYIFSAPHATYYPGGRNMSIKAVWDKKTLKLLGAQIVGFEGVDKRMDVLASAIRFGAKISDLTELDLCYAPPFGNAKDPVNMLGFVAENVISGKVKQFFWDEVDKLPRDGSVTLIDTRTEREFLTENIDGFKNIPLDSLRQRLDEIPKDRPVYVHCHSGQRSYIACRILSGHGYDCYNLSGGWRFYEVASKETAFPVSDPASYEY